MMTAEALKTYELKLDDTGEIIGGNDEGGERADQHLVRLATQLSCEQGIDFRTALDRVMANPANSEEVLRYHKYTSVEHGPNIAGLLTALRRSPLWPYEPAASQNGADGILLRAAKKWMDENGEKDMSKAVHAVLRKDPQLQDAYRDCFTGRN